MRVLESLIEVFAPHACLGCGDEGALLCEGCSLSELIEIPPQCAFCRETSKNFQTCTPCRKRFPLDFVWVATTYEDLGRKLVVATKYESKRSGCDVQAVTLSSLLPRGIEFDLIVPVPTISRHIRQRGFDHSHLVASRLAQLLQVSLGRYLHRIDQRSQLGSTRSERLRSVCGQMELRGSVRGKRVLLVDDVLTTGATVSEAAKACRKAGAKLVSAAIFSRA